MHHSRTSPASRSRRTIGVLIAALVVTLIGPAHERADAIGYSPVVDAPSPYEPQMVCTSSPRPGTVALARYLLRTYPVTRSMGMMRACSSGGRSEHKDGRAFDWGADVSKPRTRRAAYAFIRRALATDAAGNPHALARRMGIMYFIYKDTIWSSYRDFAPRPYLNPACSSLAKCSRTLRHLNHVHISLGFAGAAAQTSWYRARGIASQPVLHPGTSDLDPDETAVTGFAVNATGTTASSSFWLRPGVTYRIVATGTVRYGDGLAGDANCTWPVTSSSALANLVPTLRGTVIDPNPVDGSGGSGGWDGPWNPWEAGHEGSDHPQSPYAAPVAETHGLLLHGALRWGDTSCQPDHTYEAWYTPTVREKLQLRYLDPVPAGNTGGFTVYVARDDITRASLAD